RHLARAGDELTARTLRVIGATVEEDAAGSHDLRGGGQRPAGVGKKWRGVEIATMMSGRLARRRASMATAMSTPATRTPASASGTAIRPVPMPTSMRVGCGATARNAPMIPAVAATFACGGI